MVDLELDVPERLILEDEMPLEAPGAGQVNRRSGERERLRSEVDRRAGLDRRRQSAAQSGYDGPERRRSEERRGTGLERRRGAGVRRQEDRRNAEEGEMNDRQFEFIMAIDTYKKVNKRMYPTWTEVLEVFRQLGYRKTMPREIDLAGVPESSIET